MFIFFSCRTISPLNFLQEKWNNSVSVDSFLESLLENDAEFIVNTAFSIIKICGKIPVQSTILMDYLIELCHRKPELYSQFIKSEDPDVLNGVFYLLLKAGNEIMNTFPLNTVESCSLTLNIVKMCLQSENKVISSQVITTIADTPAFAISFTSGWYFDSESIASLFKPFAEFLIRNRCLKMYNFSHGILYRSLGFQSYFSPERFFSHRDVFYYTLCNIYFMANSTFSSPYLQHGTFTIHVFVHLLEEFICRPTLSLGYLLMSFPTRFFHEFSTTPDPLNMMIDTVLAAIKKSDPPINTKFSLTRELILEIYRPTALEIPDDKIILFSYHCPAITSRMLSRIREIFASPTYTLAISFAKDILRSLDDFVTLFVMTQHLDPFLGDLYKSVLKSRTWDAFEALFLLFVSVLKKIWTSGSELKRQHLLDFVLSFDDLQMQYSVYYILVCDTEEAMHPRLHAEWDILTSWNKKDSPLSQFNSLLTYLMEGKDSVDFNNLGAALESRSFLWLPVMVYGIIKQPPQLKNLYHIPFHQSQLFDEMFHKMVLRNSDNNINWVSVAAFPDYDMKIMFHPPSIESIVPFLHTQLTELHSADSIHRRHTKNLIISWRSWIKIFGYKKFLLTLFNFLKHFLIAHPNDAIIHDMYKISAFLLLDIQLPDESVTVECLIDYIENDLDSQVSNYFASFCIFLVVGLGINDPGFLKMYEYCISLLRSYDSAQLPKVEFALHFLRSSLNIPNINQIIKLDITNELIKFNDWQTIIQYYLTYKTI